MIRLARNSRLTMWFVGCCDYLPFASSKKGIHYLENGTTLCHIFWAALWMPIIAVCLAGLAVFIFGMGHVAAYREYGYRIGPAAFIAPELFALGMAVVFATVALAIIGGDKSGFFKLLRQYLSGVKSRICPLVKFDSDMGRVAGRAKDV
jgi:hypothetical protein